MDCQYYSAPFLPFYLPFFPDDKIVAIYMGWRECNECLIQIIVTMDHSEFYQPMSSQEALFLSEIRSVFSLLMRGLS